MSNNSGNIEQQSGADKLARRQFVDLLAAGAGAAAAGLTAASAPAAPRPYDAPGSLFDKLYGCLAGCFVGSAMGVVTEGWPYERTIATYGVLKTLEPWPRYGLYWPAGSTEDGCERIKHLCTAIMIKQDRITADDVLKTWLKVMTPEKVEQMKMTCEPFDIQLMALAKSGAVPTAALLGTFNPYTHLSTTIRCACPLAMINACDPDTTVRDVCDVFRIYQPPTSDAFPWGAAYNAALAHAFRQDATVDSIIKTALAYGTPAVQRELKRVIDAALKYTNDPFEMRKEFAQMYAARAVRYGGAYANVIACKGIAVFVATKGNVEQSIILGANFGGDTDCTTAAAATLAGALSGASKIPPEWIRTVDAATKQKFCSNSQLTMRETTEGIYRALQNRVKKMKAYETLLES